MTTCSCIKIPHSVVMCINEGTFVRSLEKASNIKDYLPDHHEFTRDYGRTHTSPKIFPRNFPHVTTTTRKKRENQSQRDTIIRMQNISTSPRSPNKPDDALSSGAIFFSSFHRVNINKRQIGSTRQNNMDNNCHEATPCRNSLSCISIKGKL